MIVHTQLPFSSTINISAQEGDMVYYLPNVGQSGSFNTGNISNLIQMGEIVSIDSNSITVEHDSSNTPSIGAYIMFVKDKKINTSSLVGYYAEVKFENNSTSFAEIFGAGTGVSESSK